jgi:hypothetical protein
MLVGGILVAEERKEPGKKGKGLCWLCSMEVEAWNASKTTRMTKAGREFEQLQSTDLVYLLYLVLRVGSIPLIIPIQSTTTMYTTTSAPRKRHRDSSSSPDSPPPQPRERSISPDRTSDFESLPAHLVGPARKRRRKDAEGKGPFIRTGFERMALEESDEETVRGNQGVMRQTEEFVDETPPLGEREFTFQPGMTGIYDTYRTRTAEGQGFGTSVVRPQSVEMPLSPDGVVKEVPTEGEGMVEDVSDPEAGGIPSTLRGKNWYEPEKDRESPPGIPLFRPLLISRRDNRHESERYGIRYIT